MLSYKWKAPTGEEIPFLPIKVQVQTTTEIRVEVSGEMMDAAYAVGLLIAQRNWLNKQCDILRTQLADLKAGIKNEQ